MSIKAGLVGLPNVGKSTLFNALTKSSVPAENYPFCTIDPHVACTFVPDDRTIKLKDLYKSEKIIPATVQFVDIAGLVKGAASGEGLGNQFLSHIKEVDLIIHVLRCFDDSNIMAVRGEIDPLIDYDIIMTELMLKDIESTEKRISKIGQLIKQAKGNLAQQKELILEEEFLKEILPFLNKQDLAAIHEIVKKYPIHIIPLICTKNFIIVANISENEIAEEAYKNNPNYRKLVEKFGENKVIPISAKIEYELSNLSGQELEEMSNMFGIKKSGLDNIISKTYANLGLITFFTCGPKEIHAWPIKSGITVRKAAGEIHSDLEKGFICADVFNCQDFFNYPTEAKLKEHGKIRTEGQDYIVQDGDIIHIKFNV